MDMTDAERLAMMRCPWCAVPQPWACDTCFLIAYCNKLESKLAAREERIAALEAENALLIKKQDHYIAESLRLIAESEAQLAAAQEQRSDFKLQGE